MGSKMGSETWSKTGSRQRRLLKASWRALGTLLDALGGLWGQILETVSISYGSRGGPGAEGIRVFMVTGWFWPQGGTIKGGGSIRLIAIRT